MNAKQALKQVAKQLEDARRKELLYIADVRDYNACIEHMIKHGSPCDYCEDLEDCKSEGKDVAIGCDMWMLRSQKITQDDVNGGDADAGEGLSLECS